MKRLAVFMLLLACGRGGGSCPPQYAAQSGGSTSSGTKLCEVVK